MRALSGLPLISNDGPDFPPLICMDVRRNISLDVFFCYTPTLVRFMNIFAEIIFVGRFKPR
jgi:hypothetical protein